MGYFCAWIWSLALYPFVNLAPTITGLVTGTDGGVLGGELAGMVSPGGALDSKITPVMESLMPVGYALCLLFFLISLLELAMSERMTMEYMIKFFSKFVVGVVAIYYCRDIFKICREMGATMSTWVSMSAAKTVEIPSLENVFYQYVTTGGGAAWIFAVLGSLVGAAPLLFIAFGLLGMTYVTVFTWLLEMGARGIFLPIALSLLSDDGWRGAGGRYIKKFLAICCQGVVMVIIASLMTSIMQVAMGGVVKAVGDGFTGTDGFLGIGGEDANFMLQLLKSTVVVAGVGIASFSVMGKSMSIISDVFGG